MPSHLQSSQPRLAGVHVCKVAGQTVTIIMHLVVAPLLCPSSLARMAEWLAPTTASSCCNPLRHPFPDSPSLCVPPLRLFCKSRLVDPLSLSSPDTLRQTLRLWLDSVKALLSDPSPLPNHVSSHAQSHASTPTFNSPTHSTGGSDEVGTDLFVGLDDSALRSAFELVALGVEVGVADCFYGSGSLVRFF